MKKEEPTPKNKVVETPKPIEDKKPIETPKPEPKPEKSAKKPSAKQHFADQFASEKERISGKPFKGEPNLEDAGDSGLLQKYYKNWLFCEA